MGREVVIAIATAGSGGINDVVAEVFARAPTFTIVKVVNGEVKEVRTIRNPAKGYSVGIGPIVVKALVDMGVKAVVGPEFGVSVETMLKEHGVVAVTAKSGVGVREAVAKALREVEARGKP